MIDRSIKLGFLRIAYFILFIYQTLLAIIPTLEYYFHHSRFRIPKNLRVPEHIAFAFTNEAHLLDLTAITDLICWCKQLGIKYITLYDEYGELKKNQNELNSYLDDRFSLLATTCYLATSNGNGYVTSNETSTKIDHIMSYMKGLSILSKRDGRRKFVEDVKGLIERVDPGKIDIDLVQKHVGWTRDPELLVTFGTQQCLYGFPPWQLRLTEIFSLPSHRRLTHSMFIDCLEKYSRTTQRLGA